MTAFWVLLAFNAGWLGCRMKGSIIRARQAGMTIRDVVAPKRGDRGDKVPSVTEVS